jgi:uncharacterized protein YyaL (SSP411 family)
VTNRLAESTSPYLQQHAGNPVDWQEWGAAAFAEARRRAVPMIVSVGYAACHWCHVMAHESFEDPAIAELMNRSFVCVKVDREERPDVDAVYMVATQLLSGQGGWPMTVFATPDGAPFFAGTYFPPRPAYGRPSFRQVLEAVADAWAYRRAEVLAGAESVRAHLRPSPLLAVPDGADPAPGALAVALANLERTFDARHGGFGPAPKFPASSVLEWLLRHNARTGSPEALEMAGCTLEAMARGGIYDQLGGGFARYSVDAQWVVPHFEKMLYDNALLLRVYAHAWRATGAALARRVCVETGDWLLRELRTPEGAFAASLDADSPGPDDQELEGAYYVWTPAELAAELGVDEGAWAAQVLGVSAAGTFEGGASVLRLPADPPPEHAARFEDVRRRLRSARARRAPPDRDDKVVTAWNGMAIAALADAGALLGRPDWVEAAASAAAFLLRAHAASPGPERRIRLVRASRDGVAGTAAGVLEDYVHLADGLLALYAADHDRRWVERTRGLLDAVLDHFSDGAGTFFDTRDDDTDPVVEHLGRPQELADGATPSGTAVAAAALVGYAALTGAEGYRDAGERALERLLPLAEQSTRAAGSALALAEAVLDGPREVAIVGAGDDPRTAALVRAARLGTAPGAVLAVAAPGQDPGLVALLRDRPLVGGGPAAYVCRRFACERPTTRPEDLALALGAREDPPAVLWARGPGYT